MRSVTVLLICAIGFAFCTGKSVKTTNHIESPSQLLGLVDKSFFENEEIAKWHNKAYDEYQPKTAIIKNFDTLYKNIQLEVFFGEWCSDSQREVPAFHKILDQADILNLNIKYISLDEDKKEPGNSQVLRQVEYVPSFIFFRDEKEIGRIVESPMKSLEEDIYEILSK